MVFSLRASHKSVVVLPASGFTQVFDNLFVRFACFLCQSSQGRPQVGTVVTAELETKDVVRDLGIELPVHILRMQTFWNIMFQDFQCIAFQRAQFASATAMSDQASLIKPPSPPSQP